MANYGNSPATSADPHWVSTHFVSKYYDVLAHHPEFLQRFYKHDSILTVTDMNEKSPAPRISTDLEAIQDLVNKSVAGAKATTKHVDAQFSINGGVLLHVAGVMTRKGTDHMCEFDQTFFLATQENGFYVRNDMLRVYPARAAAPATSNGNHAAAPAAAPAAPVAAAPAAAPAPEAAPAKPAAPAAETAKPAKPAPPAPQPTPQAPAPPAPAAAPRKPTPTRTAEPAPPASPAPPVNTSWAALVKTPNTQGKAPAAAPAKATAPAAEPAPAEAAEQPAANGDIPPPPAQPQADTGVSTSGAHPAREREVLNVVVVRNLPLEHLDLTALENEFERFGKLRRSPPGAPVTIHNLGREQGKVAYVKYEDAAGMEAALQASNVTIMERTVEIRRHEGPLPSYNRTGGRGGGFRMGGGRGPMTGGPGRGDGPAGGRGGRGERAPRAPEGGRGSGERRPSGGAGPAPPQPGPAAGSGGGRGGAGRGGRGGRGGRDGAQDSAGAAASGKAE